jgi:hypothetical protein
MRRWPGATLAAASLLALAACGGTQAVSHQTVANISVTGEGHSCADRVGDSTGRADLSDVLVQSEASESRWRISWTLNTPPSAHASVRYALHASNPSGQRRTLVVATHGGKATEHYVQLPHRRITLPIEMAETARTVQVTGSRVVGFFPGPALNDLGSDWAFYATVGVDGGLVDSCPDQQGGSPRGLLYKG